MNTKNIDIMLYICTTQILLQIDIYFVEECEQEMDTNETIQ